MRIVIKMNYVKDIHLLIDDIYKKYRNKIISVKKTKREIEFINGDSIKFISDMKYTDGIRADVAIGSDIEHITFLSSQEKRVWDFIDLENYLKSI